MITIIVHQQLEQPQLSDRNSLINTSLSLNIIAEMLNIMISGSLLVWWVLVSCSSVVWREEK